MTMDNKSQEKEFLKLIKTKKDNRSLIPNTFEQFTNDVLPELKSLRDMACEKNENIYQLSHATNLSAANAITRTYSTKLGLLWERIANLSPNVTSPELDFGFKIPEVDVVVLYESNLYYTQLKTQKNTLTGSQGHRTIAELTAFEHHWFVACIETNASWTAPKTLNRLLGRQFWSKIGIDYDKDIVPNLKKSVSAVESLITYKR